MIPLSVHIYAQDESGVAEDTEWYNDRPISAFEFKGLSSVSRLDMQNVLSEYKGKKFTIELLNEIQNTLYELEYFEEVTPEAQRGFNDELILIFTVVERPTINKIEFTGNQVIGDTALRSSVTIRRNDIFNTFKADDEVKAIKRKYFDQGYPSVQVDYTTRPADNGKNQLVLEFLIQEGGRIVVKELNFEGNEILRDGKLRRTISTKKKTLINKGTFSEELLESDKEAILQQYFKRGYIDTRVVDIIVNKEDDPQKEGGTAVELTYILQEGSLYTFDSITFQGNEIYSSEELIKLFPLKKGDKMDMTRFQRGYDRMRLKYADQGFIFNFYDYEEIRDTDVNSLAFIITVEELDQSHIENIIISGNIKTKEYVIRRELGISEGDVFSASALNYARQNLMGLRFFNSVVPDSRPGSAPGLIDLIFNVEESLTRDIRVGATFGGSSEFPLSLFLSWNQPNLAGRGLILSISGSGSPFEQTISSSFTDPNFLQSPFSFSTGLAFSHEQVNNVPQDITAPYYDAGDTGINYDGYSGHYVFTKSHTINGVTYSAGDPFPGKPSDDDITKYDLRKDSEYFGANNRSVYNNSTMTYDNFRISYTIGTGYQYRIPWGRLGTTMSIGPIFNFLYYDANLYRPADSKIRDNLNNLKVYNVYSIKGYYDGRDLSYIPTKGAYVSQKFDFYGGLLFGDAHFIRSTSVVEGHVPLLNWKMFENWSWKIVLAGQSVFTTILPQYFYPPGTSFETHGPTYLQKLDLNGTYNSRGWSRIRNGMATWNNWVELRMPLYETVIWWDQFIEASRLWSNVDHIPQSFDLPEYRFTLGTGFRFVIPQFPIRIYLGKRFNFNDENELVWQTGNLSGTDAEEGSGLDLIFTLGIDFF